MGDLEICHIIAAVAAEARRGTSDPNHRVLLSGFWQSYGLIRPYKDQIRDLFTIAGFDDNPSIVGPGPNDIVIHIRSVKNFVCSTKRASKIIDREREWEREREGRERPNKHEPADNVVQSIGFPSTSCQHINPTEVMIPSKGALIVCCHKVVENNQPHPTGICLSYGLSLPYIY